MRQGRGRAWWGLLVVAATAGDLKVAPANSAWAAGSLKITAIRTDGDYGDAAWYVFPNGKTMQLDGGPSGLFPYTYPVFTDTKITQFLDSVIGNGGTIWYMAMSHGHVDHFRGLISSLTRYVVMRYYSSFPENDTTAQTLSTTDYSYLTSALNTEFPTDYKTNVNCYEIVANANPDITKKVSGPSGVNLGPGWDASVDALVVSGEEMSINIDPNPNAVSYHIWYGSNTFETGGDMKGPGGSDDVESVLVTNYGGTGGRIKTNVSLYKIHHHGSNDSTADAFLDNILPADPMRRYAYACNGDTSAASNYSFTMANRLYPRQVTIYRSDLDGRIRFAATGNGEWCLTRQYYYSEGGTTSHSDVFAPPTIGTLSGAVSGSNVNLSWTAATAPAPLSIKAYDVYRSTILGGIDIPFTTGEDPASANWRTGSVTGLYTKIARVASPGTTHQDSSARCGTFYYRIRALHSYYYESDFSNQVTVSPTDAAAPAVPGGGGVADVPSDQGFTLRLSWTANTEVDLKDYGVYRALASGALGTKTLITQVTVPGTTQQDAGLVNNTTYYYQVTGRDLCLNESGGSTEVSVYPQDNLAPATPTGFTVSDPGAGSALNLYWTANTEADLKDYRVRRSTGSGITAQTAVLATIATPGTTHQDGGLTAGQNYFYRLTARDVSTNESGLSAELGGNIGTPAAPAGVGGSNTAGGANVGGRLTLSWTANTESDRKDYGVYRALASGALGTKTLITRVNDPGTTHQDAALTDNTTYYYQITARDTSNFESGGSSEVSAYPADSLAPATPTGLTGASAGTDQVRLNWTANTEPDRKDYRIYRTTSTSGVVQGSTWTVVTATILSPGTTHMDAGLTVGVTYRYRLSARDTTLNESGLSTEILVTPGPPSVPTGLGVADVAPNEGTVLNLSWTANPEGDMQDYGVYRALSSGALGTKTLITRVASPGTTHQDGGLVARTTYYYQLTARNTLPAESGGSAEVSIFPVDEVAPAAPTGLGITDPGASTLLRISWTANTEPDIRDYRVFRSINLGVTQVSSHVVTVILSPGTTHEDAGLVRGTTYYYRLSGRDTSNNESGLSAEGSAAPTNFLDPFPAGPNTVGHECFVVYLDSTNAATAAAPVYDIYDGTKLTWAGAAVAASTGTGGSWYRIKPAPNKNERILAYRDANVGIDKVYLQVWDGTNWGNILTVDQDGTAVPENRSWDVAYEGVTANAWFAYRTAATAGPSAYKWDGSAWTSQGVIGTGWPSGAIQWIRMQDNPLANSNEITMVVQFGTADGYWASVYNGTTWSAAKQLDVRGKNNSDQTMDVAYETASGDCVVMWVNNGSGSTSTIKCIQHSGGAWDSTNTIVSTGTNLPAVLDPIRSIRLAANPYSTSTTIMAVYSDGVTGAGVTTGGDNAIVWNGNPPWVYGKQLATGDADLTGGSANSRPFEAVYTSTGTGYAIFNNPVNASRGTPQWFNAAWNATAATGGDIGGNANFWFASATPDTAQSTVILAGKEDNGTTAVDAVQAQVLGSGAAPRSLSTNAGATNAHPAFALTWEEKYVTGKWPRITVTNAAPGTSQIPAGSSVALLRILVENRQNAGGKDIELFRVKARLTSDSAAPGTALTKANVENLFAAMAVYENTYDPDSANPTFQADQDTLVVRRASFANFSNGVVDVSTDNTSGSVITPQNSKTYWLVGELNPTPTVTSFAIQLDADGNTTNGGRVDCRDKNSNNITKNQNTANILSPLLSVYVPPTAISGYPVTVSAGYALEALPTLAANTNDWYIASTSSRVYKYSLAGLQQWASPVLTAFRCPVLFSREGANDYLYVGSDAGNLYKLQDNGGSVTVTWTRVLNSTATFRTRPLLKSIGGVDYVFMGGSDARVYKCRADDSVAPISVAVNGGVTGGGLTMNFEALGGTTFYYWFGGAASGNIYKGNANGNPLAAPAAVRVTTGTVLTAGMLSFDNSRLMFGSDDTKIYSFDTGATFTQTAYFTADGAVAPTFHVGRDVGSRVFWGTAVSTGTGTIWARTIPIQVGGTTPWTINAGAAVRGQVVAYPGLSPTRVFAGTDAGFVYAIDNAAGTVVSGWPVQVGGQVLALMVNPTGTPRVYIPTGGGKVYAYTVP